MEKGEGRRVGITSNGCHKHLGIIQRRPASTLGQASDLRNPQKSHVVGEGLQMGDLVIR